MHDDVRSLMNEEDQPIFRSGPVLLSFIFSWSFATLCMTWWMHRSHSHLNLWTSFGSVDYGPLRTESKRYTLMSLEYDLWCMPGNIRIVSEQISKTVYVTLAHSLLYKYRFNHLGTISWLPSWFSRHEPWVIIIKAAERIRSYPA